MASLKMNALTTEYVHVPVTATGELLGYPVFFAILAKGARPTDGDWIAGSWDPDVTSSPFRARVLVGPEGGVMTLTKGASYDVWVKVDDNPETPIRLSGTITAT